MAEYVQAQWEAALQANYLEKIGLAILVLALAIFLKKFFTKVILVLLRKIAGRTKSTMDDAVVNELDKPIQFAFIIVGLQLAIQILSLPPQIDLFLDRVIRSLVLFTIFWAGYRITNVLNLILENKALQTSDRFDDMLFSFLSKGIKIVIVCIGAITIAQVWFEEVAGVLAGLGLGGLAFALAAQDTAKNLFGSVTIMLDRPFNIGDWIQTPSVEGTVEEIGFRSTKVRTFSQALVTIPNSIMSNEAITNWSRMGKRRITFHLKLCHHTSTEKVQEFLNSLRTLLKEHPEIHPETIFVNLERIEENALKIFFYFFTNTTNWKKYLEVQEDINLRIMALVNELGISLALPSRTVYYGDSKKES